jgi:LuxR family transcriptional regulator, maltose regulon positive regulatory protein
MQLINAKIAIPDAEGIQPRPRLLGALAESIEHCSATVLVGRAGTGKTALVADFARSCGRQVAWFKVDASDFGFKPFVEYLVAAIAARQPGFGAATLATVGNTGCLNDYATTAEQFISELLERSEPLLLVIDDFHLVYDAEWLVPFFGRLLPLLPLDTHLLILARTLPPGPLWRLRSKQAMCVIDEAALAFNEREAIDLFKSYGIDSAHAAGVIAQTYGRAALLDSIARQLAYPTDAAGPGPAADFFRGWLGGRRAPVVGAA